MNKIVNFIKKTIIITVVSINLQAIALKNDTKQLLNIYSDKQSVDLKKNTIFFTNNVIIKQGTINIKADKVIITKEKKKPNKIIIESIGSPAKFYQLQNDGKKTNGYANNIRYEIDKKIIILTGNACIKQLDNSITSNKIIYIITEQKIEAFGDKNNRVVTILSPTKLQKK